MTGRIARFLFLIAAITGFQAAAGNHWYDGSWSGDLNVMGVKLTLNFNFTSAGDGDDITCTLDSPNQNAFGIPCSKVVISHNADKASGDTIEVSIDALRASYRGVVCGDSVIDGKFKQGMEFPLTLHRIAAPAVAAQRKQTPKAPFPYKTRDVKIQNTADGVTLAGTLTLPAEGKNFPAVVLVSGSGAQNRDEEMMGGHRPFAVIADYLTRHGIAVLRYDDRGTAESTGDFKSCITQDFARDAEAAFKFLASQPEINKKKIGYLGHSEGGMIAFMNAAKDKNVAFIVTLAAPATKGRDLMIRQTGLIAAIIRSSEIVKHDRKTEMIFDAIDQATDSATLRKQLFGILTDGGCPDSIPAEQRKNIEQQISVMTSPWYMNFIKYDPANAIRAVKCSVFALGGSLDSQVDAEINLAAIRSLCGSKRVETQLYPGLNHLFQSCKPGMESLMYNQIEETISPQVLDDMAKWITSVAK